MAKHLIYDLPVRLFHWLFAGLFLGAFLIAKTVDDDSAWFSYHMLAGLTLSFAVLLRVIWGFVGTHYARFTSFALHPKELVAYFAAMLSGEKRKWIGHNPASSWAALIMFVLALGLGVTGFLMTSGYKAAFEEIHEWLANAFLIVVILHIAGVILHTMRHRDSILVTMIHGGKKGIPVPEAIPTRPLVGAIFVALIVFFGMSLKSGFDSGQGTLSFLGRTLKLQKAENGTEQHEAKDRSEERETDDDD